MSTPSRSKPTPLKHARSESVLNADCFRSSEDTQDSQSACPNDYTRNNSMLDTVPDMQGQARAGVGVAPQLCSPADLISDVSPPAVVPLPALAT